MHDAPTLEESTDERKRRLGERRRNASALYKLLIDRRPQGNPVGLDQITAVRPVLVPKLSQHVEATAANAVDINEDPVVTDDSTVRSVCLEIAATRIDASAIGSEAIEVIGGTPHATVSLLKRRSK
jgi:hypothetical protein